MHYLLSHRTTYTYASTVDSAHHIAHLRARDFPGQKVTSISIVTSPLPALATQHVDHFGNLIDIYRIDKPHTRFDIEVRAEVEVRFPEPPVAASTPPWEEIRAALHGDGFPRRVDVSEFIHESPLVPSVEALRAYGAVSLTPGRPILEAARELTSRIKADFEYHPAPPTSRRRWGTSSPARPVSARTSRMSRSPRSGRTVSRPVTSRATSARSIPARRSPCAAPTRATPGWRCGAARMPAGSISIPPTT